MAGKRKYCIGIDVGTGSVRAGIFDLKGKRAAIAVKPIQIHRPAADFVEQSSEDIWNAVCHCVKHALREGNVSREDVVGIGFDATCSLVALDSEGKPLSVSPAGNPEHNIIVWMDHRAVQQAERINATRHKVLRYVGGTISPEMEPPKLLWLKEHNPKTFKKAGYFFDLADFLSFRATGDTTRSLCTTVCKWTYQGHLEAKAGADSVGKWDDSFWNTIGIPEFVKEGYARIGTRVRPMGEPVGKGLTKKGAAELGLAAGTPVGVGIIDAHAGGLGLLGIRISDASLTPAKIEKRLALIGGTSSCHMTASRKPFFIKGIWGPYFSAMIPGMWLTEGGQSATGALIDHVIFSHARADELQKEADSKNITIYQLLEDILSEIAQKKKVRFDAELSRDRHVLPYYHGNRSPRADPTLRGIMTGMALDDSAEALALHYLATVQSIAYGTRHIIETMNSYGYQINTIFACGGGTKSDLYLRSHADATGCPIIMGKEPEAVLLGSAILGAIASGSFGSFMEAMQEMNEPGRIVKPVGGKVREFHNKKYKVFHTLYDSFMQLRRSMK